MLRSGDLYYRSSPAIEAGTPTGTDIGALPFEPAGLASPTGVSLEQVNDEAWDLIWTPTTASSSYVYYSACSRQTTTVVDAGSSNQYRIEGVSTDGIGYAGVSAYDEN